MKNLNSKISDPKLPQLSRVLNESFMQGFFQKYFHNELSNGSGEITQCKIIGKRYKPGKRCIVTYVLNFERNSKQQILFTRIQNPKHAEKNQGRLQSKEAKYVSELGMYLWCFPHDPKLTCLAELTNPRHMKQILTDVLNLNLDDHGQEDGVTIKPFNYVPRRHCALMVEINGFGKRVKVFGKIYGNGRGANVYSVMKQLWQQQASHSGAFGVTKPLAYDEKHKVLWQQWSQGQSFLQFAQNKGLERACMLTAFGLADFHRSNLQGLRSYSQEDHFKKFIERAELLSSPGPGRRVAVG